VILLAMTLLAAQGVSAKEIEFGSLGSLRVPEGCSHVARQGVDSAVGYVECGDGHSRIQYDIGFASPGAKPEPRGWCTVVEESERRPLRLVELPIDARRSLYVCELPPYYDDPARLVAVPSPTVSFYTAVKSPADASWLLTVALAFRPR
jgi:hypothetical protein